MEITLSKKSVSNIFSVFFLLVLIIGGGYFAWSNGIFDRWLHPVAAPFAPAPDEPALLAIQTMYAPDVTGTQADWEAGVCAGMSQRNCDLFRVMYAHTIWNAAVAAPMNGVVVFDSVAETFESGRQVWKVNLTTSTGTQPLYLLVSKNETGRWLLERLLFEQEAKKYQAQ